MSMVGSAKAFLSILLAFIATENVFVLVPSSPSVHLTRKGKDNRYSLHRQVDKHANTSNLFGPTFSTKSIFTVACFMLIMQPLSTTSTKRKQRSVFVQTFDSATNFRPCRASEIFATASTRFLMVSAIGKVHQDGLTGPRACERRSSCTPSIMLRSFENELGVQEPLGYWDPVGLGSDGDQVTFKRRRESEIKHGRVAMYATLGYIVPEWYRWPGFLSVSQRLKFTQIPNGLSAIKYVPALGWFQILVFCGCFEIAFGYSKWLQDGSKPGAYGWKAITDTSSEGVRRKLNSEIANGRLAMNSVIGMFFQDGLTGRAWGDWLDYLDSPLRAFDDEFACAIPPSYELGESRLDANLRNDRQGHHEIEHRHGRM